ncbi:MAG TPA: 2-oxo-4-hydroxy-4-carboxy-5-ureidoimidazoline decarboxylase [Gemmatimonadales bacterium]|nr:2-oxo-4-hydroxy-4-carboxy-5-ureidoimidazoline decarboxylase [Gemmatimonadales bacterium]
MTLSLAELDRLSRSEAGEHLRACCGSSRWVELMLAARPFGGIETALAAADRAWQACEPADWDEAFAHHPRIGERHAAAPVGAVASGWSAGEQGAAARGDAGTRAALAEANAAYERRFGRIYIVCATGRSAEDLLADIEARMGNDPERERAVAAEEQRKIIRLRLLKLLGAEPT